jgi:hypothetical protein
MKTNDTEQSELAECEAAIERNLSVFYETGQALQKIRDERLYRVTHETFEQYCKERWDMSKAYANRTIEASLIVANLTPMGVIPTSERQSRELAGLSLDDQRKVWQKAIKTAPNGNVTSAHIRETRESLLGSRSAPVQAELFTLEDYREVIKDHVDAANHHHREGKHHRVKEKHHRREAIRLRDEAFKKFRVQIELPFEDEGD